MGKAKDILLKPISAQEANALVRRVHYSGKVVNNSQLHIGVFYEGQLEGAMQFGPSLDKRKIQGLVKGTLWHEFIELNRLAFTDVLPRNSESRALAIAMRLIRKHAPQVKWVITFADGTQCGDGTIYRAAGFVLTGIKKNDQIWVAPESAEGGREVDLAPTLRYGKNGGGVQYRRARELAAGARFSRTSLTDGRSKRQQRQAVSLSRVTATKGNNILETGGASMALFKEAGFSPLEGFQLRYVYFIDPTYRERLTVPELPYSAIAEAGARMYKGERLDARPVNGDGLTTSEVGRFDSDQGALDSDEVQHG